MQDFNNAERQVEFELIPDKSIVKLAMNIRPGNAGEDGWLTASRSSDSQYFSCEFTVTEGPYVRRKIFQNIGYCGGKLNDKGESVYGNIGRSFLRAILESARGLRADDMSENATRQRQINGWGDFCGMVFLAKIGIDKGKDGYSDKNKITVAITADMKEYHEMSTLPAIAAPATAQPTQTTVPTWAQAAPPAAMQTAKPSQTTIPPWAR